MVIFLIILITQLTSNCSIFDSIKPNERTAAYCVGIRNGTSDDWEFLWKRYSYFDNAAKQIEIINALGCSLNTTILEK